MSTSILGTHIHGDAEEGDVCSAHDDSHEHHVQPAPVHAHTHSVHAAHSHPHPRKKSRGPLWVSVGLCLGILAGGAGLWLSSSMDNPSAPPPPNSAALMEQMHSASQGWIDGNNLFGGKLKSEEVNGHQVVTVTDIPNKQCVEASWALAREGQVTVNSVFLPRISAGKLAELCASGNNKSTILWMVR